MISGQKLFNDLFEGLSDRQVQVLTARFGLGGKDPQTLEAIGKNYGITRERVRQIEAAALGSLKSKIQDSRECGEIFAKSQKYLKGVGGIAKKEDMLHFIASFVDGIEESHVALLIEAAGPFHFYEEDEKFNSFYYLDKESMKQANDTIQNFVKSLKEKRDEVLGGGYEAHLASFVKRMGGLGKTFPNLLAVSKRIQKNPYGDIGLAEWAVIDPRTVRDRIYLVLKKESKPVHFRVIAELINHAGFGGRKALAPTVHNELIKDKRFVLVGRGIYGLAEHGFEPGIAREVIHKILKQDGPMKFPEVVLAVQKERFFKPNTVLANLQNKNLFERTKDGTYRVRES